MTIAARIEARVRLLSARERTILLVCALVVVAFGVVRWMVYPALEEYRKDRALIPVRRAELERYRMIRAGEGDVAGALAAKVNELEKAEEGLLVGSDPSAAGAALQGLVKPMADRPDTRLTSVRSISPVPKGEYTEVAVQMDMQTTMEGLASILAAVPRQQKVLQVKKLSVLSSAYVAGRPIRAETLRVSLTVSGLAAAPEEAKGEKGGGP
ncbi:MAG: type II secretion system protein GspM [Candidatus Deferrimicrobiaceae bacterium]